MREKNKEAIPTPLTNKKVCKRDTFWCFFLKLKLENECAILPGKKSKVPSSDFWPAFDENEIRHGCDFLLENVFLHFAL